MLVKCRACKDKKIDRDTAFKVVVKGKNNYYCNEQEYKNICLEKEAKEMTTEAIYDIIGVTTNTSLFKEISSIAKLHSYRKISSYLEKDKDKLKRIMNRDFAKEYGKIKYFFAVVKNNIGEHIIQEKENKNISKEFEFVEVNYSPKKRKKSIADYMREYIEEE